MKLDKDKIANLGLIAMTLMLIVPYALEWITLYDVLTNITLLFIAVLVKIVIEKRKEKRKRKELEDKQEDSGANR